MNQHFHSWSVPAPYLNPYIPVNSSHAFPNMPPMSSQAPLIGSSQAAVMSPSPYPCQFPRQIVPVQYSIPSPANFHRQGMISAQTIQGAAANSSANIPSQPSSVADGSLSVSNASLHRNSLDIANRRNTVEVDELMDANYAGSIRSLDCTLILTEGKATMSLAAAGLSEVGKDLYGLYPLKRRLVNVRKSTRKAIESDSDIKSIMKALGLRFECTYETEEERQTLRYGKVILMMDRDEDGSHMKGLVINFFHYLWPCLLKSNGFSVLQLILPIVKIYQSGRYVQSFYALEDYEEWIAQPEISDVVNIAARYCKSIESFTPQEIREYFADLRRNCVPFLYEDHEDDEAMILAFEKDKEDSRKRWIDRTMRESFVYYEEQGGIRYKDFINKELLFYSDLQNLRSFPSAIDGLTRSQRKVLHACFKRTYEQEFSLLRLMGSVFDVSGYTQTMEALGQTIIGMAQDFVGTNNINILIPFGQFGTRLHGGKDAGKPQYLHTKLNSIMKYIFSEEDFPILDYRKDCDLSIEPTHYLPIIPMVLVNGSDGIGTGWKTKIPKYNPKNVITNLFRMLNDLEPLPMVPYFKDFQGQIEPLNSNQFYSYGIISVLDNNQARITELPIGVWTEIYKEKVLNGLQQNGEILHYEEYHTDTLVNFLITVREHNLNDLSEEGLYSMFQLRTIEKSHFVAFDHRGLVKDYEDPISILKEFFDFRLTKYQSRKDYILSKLRFHLQKLEDLLRSILYSDGNRSMYNLQCGRYNFAYDVSRIQENKNVLERDIREIAERLENLESKSPEDLWKEELEELCRNLDISIPDFHASDDSEFISSLNNLNI